MVDAQTVDSPDVRERLYRELAESAPALEQFAGGLKRVIRLAKPTVVHIEARKSENDFSAKPVDEAGAGRIGPVRHA